MRFLIAAAAGAALIAYGATLASGHAPPWAPWLLAFAGPTTLAAFMHLGAARAGRTSPLTTAAIILVWAILTAGLALALRAAPVTPDAALYLGLPRAAAIVVYGVGLLPLFILPLAYALDFDRGVLSADDLATVRAMKAHPDA
jgi:hypothetical protein